MNKTYVLYFRLMQSKTMYSMDQNYKVRKMNTFYLKYINFVFKNVFALLLWTLLTPQSFIIFLIKLINDIIVISYVSIGLFQRYWHNLTYLRKQVEFVILASGWYVMASGLVLIWWKVMLFVLFFKLFFPCDFFLLA